MKCDYKKAIPGDCHVACDRKWTLKTAPQELIDAIHRMPSHAGMYPYCFNDVFICGKCPENKE